MPTAKFVTILVVIETKSTLQFKRFAKLYFKIWWFNKEHKLNYFKDTFWKSHIVKKLGDISQEEWSAAASLRPSLTSSLMPRLASKIYVGFLLTLKLSKKELDLSLKGFSLECF